MPKLAANLTMLFGDVDFLERFKAAADSGFHGVEFLFPYAYEAAVLKQRLRDHGLVQVLHNLPAGNWAGGERGIACLPGREYDRLRLPPADNRPSPRPTSDRRDQSRWPPAT